MTLSKLISFLLHPLLMPTYVLVILFRFIPFFSLTTNNKKFMFTMSIVCLFTILIPLISLGILLATKKVSSIYMNNRKERVFPILFCLISYCICIHLLDSINIDLLIHNLLFGATIILLIAAIVSRFWKISLHMMGIGGVVGSLLSIQYVIEINIFIILISIFLSGLLGFSRINEGAHNLSQVYIGFLIGVFMELLIFLV